MTGHFTETGCEAQVCQAPSVTVDRFRIPGIVPFWRAELIPGAVSGDSGTIAQETGQGHIYSCRFFEDVRIRSWLV